MSIEPVRQPSVFQNSTSPVEDIRTWKKEDPLSEFLLTYDDCLEIIKGFLSGEISATHVTAWADIMESEWVNYDQNDDRDKANFLFDVSTPEINGEVWENITLATFCKFKKLSQT